MKKLIFSLVCLVGIGNFALASSVDDVTVGTLEKQDSQAIFGNTDVGAVSLSQSEMSETKGEFWPVLFIGARLIYMGYKYYSRVPFARTRTLTIGWASNRAY
ncbi:MAG: hypothetical protein KN64_05035 [Sulfurovum sp. AS07-7]|nr:MAG: hypothetical protein KN64_05035 [Sulfurovum sp. AS07-7]